MTSRRAKLMRELMERYSESEYSSLDDIVINADPDEPQGDVAHILAMTRALSQAIARLEAHERTTIGPLPETLDKSLLEYASRLSPEGQEWFLGTLRQALEAASQRTDDNAGRMPANDPKQVEILDRHYSLEVIDKLDQIVPRAACLEPVAVPRNAGAEIEAYFAEAHQAYLYGFPVACAVLCRAILESALKMCVRGSSGSLNDRIEEAHSIGKLGQAARVWAYDVKKIGDLAIHDYARFSRGEKSDRIQECILKTRVIVQQIFGDDAQSS